MLLPRNPGCELGTAEPLFSFPELFIEDRPVSASACCYYLVPRKGFVEFSYMHFGIRVVLSVVPQARVPGI